MKRNRTQAAPTITVQGDVIALQRDIYNKSALVQLQCDLASGWKAVEPSEIELWNFAHNLMAVAALAEDIARLEVSPPQDMNDILLKMKMEISEIVMRTIQDRKAIAEIENKLYLSLTEARGKTKDGATKGLIDRLIHAMDRKKTSKPTESMIRDDVVALQENIHDVRALERLQNRLKDDSDPFAKNMAAIGAIVQDIELLHKAKKGELQRVLNQIKCDILDLSIVTKKDKKALESVATKLFFALTELRKKTRDKEVKIQIDRILDRIEENLKK